MTCLQRRLSSHKATTNFNKMWSLCIIIGITMTSNERHSVSDHWYLTLTCLIPGAQAINKAFQWRHNERDVVLNHQPHDCSLNRLFSHGWKKASKLRVTGLCEGNSPVIDEFSTQMASNAEMFPFDDVIMGNTKEPHDWWIFFTKGQWWGKWVHGMMLS